MTFSDEIRIETRGLVKKYNQVTALDGVDFKLPSNRIYGLLGPNGAGKTTFISCVLGLLDFDGGEILIDNKLLNPSSREFKSRIGIVPQELAIYDDLSGIANIKFFGAIHGLRGPDLDKRAKELLKLTGLSDRAKDKVRTYSGGMKRRLNLACGIIHKPEIVMMDEPTVGIDPQSRNLIYELVESLANDGMTILYTTHYMDEAERLCNRIAIIDQGKIIADGTLKELIEMMGEKDTISLEVKGEIPVDKLENLLDKSLFDMKDGILRVQTVHGANKLPEIMNLLHDSKCEIASATIKAPNLEAVFLHLTGKELRD
jgi:ABC-2 type transport system ATP-binding protein